MRITFSHSQFTELLAASEDLQHIDEKMQDLDLCSRTDARDKGLDLTYQLVQAAAGAGLVWTLSEAPDQRVDVMAAFPATCEGVADLEYLEFQAYMGRGAGIASVGTNSILGLLGGEMDATSLIVLDGITDMLSAVATELAALFERATPDVPTEQRIMPISAVRDEAVENPNLSAEEANALRAASDSQIADALAESWNAVEDSYFVMHDDLQSRAVWATIAAVEAAGNARS